MGSFFAEGVNIAVVKNDTNEIEGYAVYRLGSPEIPVTEFVYTTRRAQRGLLNYFYNHRSQDEGIAGMRGCTTLAIDSFRGKTGHITMPYMMARIVDVETALTTVRLIQKRL